MNIIKKKIDEIIPYINNPRKNDGVAVDKVASSIKEFGFKVPIIIDKDNVIVTGHTRLKAAKKLNLENVPCIKADDLTEAQVKAFRIADNKVSEYSEWDEELLKVEFEALELMAVDMDITGFDLEEIELYDDKEVVEDDFNEDLDEEKEIISKRGDIIELGNHRLMCGDSTSEEDVSILMNKEKADMVFTDPPYGVSYSNNMNDKFEEIKNDDVFLDFKPVLNKFSKDNIHWYIWTSHQVYNIWRDMFKKEYKSTIIWYKGGGGLGDLNGDYAIDYEMCMFCHNGRKTLNGKREGAVWEIKKDNGSSYLHPTQKPVELGFKAISNSSVKNNVILDLFGGSGSTLIAAEQLDRKCYMMELDEKYVDVIIRRYIKYKENLNESIDIKVNGEVVDYNKYMI